MRSTNFFQWILFVCLGFLFLQIESTSGETLDNNFSVSTHALSEEQRPHSTLPAETEPPADPVVILKHKAVTEWLESYLKKNKRDAAELLSKMSLSEAEKYILDYQVQSSKQDEGYQEGDSLKLTGHVDTEGIKQWVEIQTLELHGDLLIKPGVVLTSTLPDAPLNAFDMVRPLQPSILRSTLLEVLNQEFASYHIRFLSTNVSTTETFPFQSSTERHRLNRLIEQHGQNTLFWFSVSPCAYCNTPTQVFVALYNLATLRRVFADSFEVDLSLAKDRGRSLKAWREIVRPLKHIIKQLTATKEWASSQYDIELNGIKRYEHLKLVESILKELPKTFESTLKEVTINQAIFQIASLLSPSQITTELNQRISQYSNSSPNLKLNINIRTID